MKSLLELELSGDSFFDKSYLLSRLEREAADDVPVSSSYLENAGVRFVLLSRFHDAKIIEIVNTQKYGKSCILVRIDFRETTNEFKNSYKKFEVYFIDAEYIESPEKYEELHILSLDCVQESQDLTVNMELVYFAGLQEHHCICKNIEVKPFHHTDIKRRSALSSL